MNFLVALLCGFMVVGSGAEKISDMDQGAEFTKCVKITDYQTKTLADDITLVDRETNGCCPKDTVPGAKFQSTYKSPQIVCGFKADGTITTSITSGTNAKCDYNKCYIDKQNLACADGTKQLLNGCCAKTTKDNDGFESTCKNYFKSFNTVNSDKVNYCTTYHKDYGTLGYKGTSDKTDDQKDGKLQADKIYTYTPCAGGASAESTSGVRRAAMGSMFTFAFAMTQVFRC